MVDYMQQNKQALLWDSSIERSLFRFTYFNSNQLRKPNVIMVKGNHKRFMLNLRL